MTEIDDKKNFEVIKKIQNILIELCKNPINIAVLYVLRSASYESKNSWMLEETIIEKIHENFGLAFNKDCIKQQVEILANARFQIVGSVYTLGRWWYFIDCNSQGLGGSLNKFFEHLLEFEYPKGYYQSHY